MQKYIPLKNKENRVPFLGMGPSIFLFLSIQSIKRYTGVGCTIRYDHRYLYRHNRGIK